MCAACDIVLSLLRSWIPGSMDLNFVLHTATHDAEAPEWPHFVCSDGYAWYPRPKPGYRDCQRCFQGYTEAPAERIAATLQGRPIDRVWAMRVLIVGEQPGDRRWPGALVKLYPAECRGCGRSHTKLADLWRRAALSLHPDALAAIREADPSWRLLRDPTLPESRRRIPPDRRIEATGIPVCALPEDTARAQILWASDLIARREFPMAAPRKRRKLVLDVTRGE